MEMVYLAHQFTLTFSLSSNDDMLYGMACSLAPTHEWIQIGYRSGGLAYTVLHMQANCAVANVAKCS